MPLAGWLYSVYAWSLAAVLLPLFGVVIMALRRPALARPVARMGARLLLRLAGMPIAAHGLERLPGVPHILLVNHGSFLDGVALVAMLPATPGYAFVVRQQFPVQRLLCPLLRALGTVVLLPAAAGSHAGNADLIAHALRWRGSLVIFPEAGFVPSPGLRRFHSGAFVAARRTGAPIVVAGLRGPRQALPPRRWVLYRTPLSLHIGAALAARDIGFDALIASARAALLVLSGEPDANATANATAAGGGRRTMPASPLPGMAVAEPTPPTPRPGRSAWLRRAVVPLLGLLIVGVALWGLHGMLRDTSVADIADALSALPPAKVALALACTALSYLALTQYDRLSLHWLGLRWPWRRIAPGTAMAYALGNVSFNALLVAGALRYSAWRGNGVRPAQAARVALFASLGSWLGYAALGGPLFCIAPLRPSLRPLGLLLLLAVACYLLLAWRAPTLWHGRLTAALPPPGLCLAQVAAGMLDLAGVSGVLWLLLPAMPGLSYVYFLQAYMLAMVAGSASQAPGGLGVFDSAFLLLLPAGAPVPQALAALLAFRAIYYGLPLLPAGAFFLLRPVLRHTRNGRRS